jgi:hypothetical protein
MPTVGIGEPYTPAFFVPDANGAPTTAGSAVTGTVNVYGPDSATTPVATGALSFQGEGLWGLLVAGSVHTAPGLYRYSVASLSTPAGTLVNEAGWYTTGYLSPTMLTLREIVAKLGIWLGGFVGRSTGGTAGTLIDANRLQLGQDNAFAGCELLLFEPANNTDANPVYVTGSTAATGTLAFRPNITAVGAGVEYLLLRRVSVQRLIEAVRQVLAEARVTCDVTDAVSLAGVADTFEYACPAPLCRVTGVEYRTSGAAATDWAELGAQYVAGTVRDRRLLKLRPPFDLSNAAVRVRGRAWAPPPELPAYGASGVLNAAVDADGSWVVDAAKARLQLDSRDPATQRQGAAAWQLALSRAPGQGPLTGWPVG